MTSVARSSTAAPQPTSGRALPRSARVLAGLFAHADVEFNGERPWDIQIHDSRFFDRVMAEGTLGAGEAYMDGWWDCEQLDVMFTRVLSAKLERQLPMTLTVAADLLKSRLINRQNRRWSRTVAKLHYDLGNDFYRDMLDPRMQYTCAYWSGARTLEEAQENKLDLVCRKLSLRPGMTVLELGCGWGGFARFAAERYGCTVTAYNISEQQVAYAREYNGGLPVEIRRADYRDASGSYDRVVSIGLCEHVGYKNYRTFFETIRRSLAEGGLALVHTIGGLRSTTGVDPWIGKYIFPNGMLPSMAQLTKAAENVLLIEDVHNFGPDYDPTLMSWHASFVRHWPRHEAAFDARFYRMWVYYLLLCAGSFRARKNQLWQIVLSADGVPGGYVAVR